MKFLIVLAVLLAVAIAEETKVAEAADQQVAATVYGHHGGFYGHGPVYGLHHRGYFGHGYGHGHGYRYGRSVAADVEGQESGHGHRYGRSVAADVEGQESHSSSFVEYDDLNGGYGYGLYIPRYGYYHH